jgi:hypothetical protein
MKPTATMFVSVRREKLWSLRAPTLKSRADRGEPI